MRRRFLTGCAGALLPFLSLSAGLANAADSAPRFDFVAPSGWRLRTVRPDLGLRHSYLLAPLGSGESGCGVGIGGEPAGRSLVAYEERSIALFAKRGPGRPVVRRSTLRSQSGVLVLKADARCGWYRHPDLRPDNLMSMRCLLYSFKDTAGRTYSLQAYPDVAQGDRYDAALDAMARSIRLRPAGTARNASR